MKIYFYLPNLESGGAEKMIISLANKMALRKHDVTMVLGVNKGAFKGDILDAVKVVELGTLSVLKVSFKLFKFILKNKPNVFCVTKSHVNALVALFTPFLKNTSVVLREANTPSLEYKHASYYGKCIMLFGKLTYRLADKYIAVSKGVAVDMINFYYVKKDKLQTIYNPVISSEIYSLSNEEVEHSFFEERKKNSAIYIFVAVGRLMPQKDYPTMIEAFNRAYTKNKNIRLMILGRVEKYNADYNTVTEKIEENTLKDVVSFVGFVHNPFKYLLKGDCFIQTSLFEGLPGTLIQALGLKKEIITTNCKSGPEEVLDYGKFGTLVETGNFDLISTEILEYSKGKINTKANDKFLSQFTIEVAVDSYIKLFKSLISS
jgi:glycosyltransferase involved in cell wall biosynthesis